MSNIQHTEVNGFSLSHLPAFAAILASSGSRSMDSVSSWGSQRHEEQRPKLPCCPDHGLQLTHCVSCPSENLHHGFPSSATHTEACGPIKFLCFYGSSCSTHFLFPSVFRACFCPGQQWALKPEKAKGGCPSAFGGQGAGFLPALRSGGEGLAPSFIDTYRVLFNEE